MACVLRSLRRVRRSKQRLKLEHICTLHQEEEGKGPNQTQSAEALFSKSACRLGLHDEADGNQVFELHVASFWAYYILYFSIISSGSVFALSDYSPPGKKSLMEYYWRYRWQTSAFIRHTAWTCLQRMPWQRSSEMRRTKHRYIGYVGRYLR